MSTNWYTKRQRVNPLGDSGSQREGTRERIFLTNIFVPRKDTLETVVCGFWNDPFIFCLISYPNIYLPRVHSSFCLQDDWKLNLASTPATPPPPIPSPTPHGPPRHACCHAEHFMHDSTAAQRSPFVFVIIMKTEYMYWSHDAPKSCLALSKIIALLKYPFENS